MKARRVSILLAILVISALTLFLLTLLDSEAEAAEKMNLKTRSTQPDTLGSYEETITIGPDGNARWESVVVIGKGGSGDLLLPFDFGDERNLTILSGPARFAPGPGGLPQPTLLVLGRKMLNLQTEVSATRGDTLRIAGDLPDWYRQEDFAKPHGEFVLKRRFENYSDFAMADFRMNLVLPPGMVVHSIGQVIPNFDPKKNPRPPYAISERDSRSQVAIFVTGLAPGGAAQMDLNMRPARRGLIPLIGGLLAAILYLVFFRDVLKPKETE